MQESPSCKGDMTEQQNSQEKSWEISISLNFLARVEAWFVAYARGALHSIVLFGTY